MNSPQLDHEEYIGDGVYATFDGYHVILKTQRESGVHWIALDPAVMQSLNWYAERMHRAHREKAQL